MRGFMALLLKALELLLRQVACHAPRAMEVPAGDEKARSETTAQRPKGVRATPCAPRNVAAGYRSAPSEQPGVGDEGARFSDADPPELGVQRVQEVVRLVGQDGTRHLENRRAL